MISIGTKFYKWNDDTLYEIKILKNTNDTKIKVKETSGDNKEFFISKDELLSKYTKLSPDGYITFNIVNLGKDIRDVMVTLSRSEDIKKGDPLPYAVCRQCITDIFANQTKEFHNEYFGVSVSKDTCPANVEFSNFLACDGAEYTVTVAFYIGDKLADILKMIKTKNFDIALYNLLVDRCKYAANNIKILFKNYMEQKTFDGYCRTLEELLKLNNFKYDLHRAYNIIPFDLDLAMCDGRALDPIALHELSVLLCKNIDKTIVVKYDKSIDLSKIERNYQLISDASENVYVVGYTYQGDYHIPIEDIESEESIEKLNKGTNMKSVREAYNHLAFNKDKYEQY